VMKRGRVDVAFESLDVGKLRHEFRLSTLPCLSKQND
jgi:hypothetical protein